MNCATSMKQRYRKVIEYGERSGWSQDRSRQLKAQCVKIWDRTRFMNEHSILDLVSLPLQLEVVAITRADTINRAHLIRDTPELKAVALYFMTRLRLELFCKGQQVYQFGEPTVGFFIVEKGSVQVLSKARKQHFTAGNTDNTTRIAQGEAKDGEGGETVGDDSLIDHSYLADTINTSLFTHSTIVDPVGHFGVWDAVNRCRVDSAVALSNCVLYRCPPEDLLNVMERMSDEDAARLEAEFLVHHHH